MEPFILELSEHDPARAFSAFQKYPYSLFLDSADLAHGNGNYSYILHNPALVVEVKDGVVKLRDVAGRPLLKATLSPSCKSS